MPDLRRFLRETFEQSGGEMSFEDFMSLALYDPEFGYYSSNIEDVGNGRGDFATATTLSPALGRAVASWLEREREWFGWRDLPIVEVGAGSGNLAAAILGSVNWWQRRKWRYHIVEVSPELRKRQKKRLGGRVRWHDSVGEAISACGGRAIVVSNELIDAFPAMWLRWSEEVSAFEEIWVRYSPETGLNEVVRELPESLQSGDFSALAAAPQEEGQRIEIQPSVKDWLSDVISKLETGALLTIDYGGLPETIYSGKKNGTIRGYYRNSRIEEGAIYRRFGKQDLTLDVNFQDLQDWGKQLGLASIRYETQRSFLTEMGQGDDLMAQSEAGEAFQVLHQRK